MSDPNGLSKSGPAMPEERSGPNRRQTLTMAGATIGALGAALGPFGHLLDAGAAEDDASPEISLAMFLMTLELAAVELYQSLAKVSDERTGELASACGDHHVAQGQALGAMISAAGAQVPTEANEAFLAEYSSKVTPTTEPKTLAQTLSDMENGFAASYQAALSTIVSASLAMIAAQILGTDSAHVVAWSAVADGQGSATPLPDQAVLVPAQTTVGAFTEKAFALPTTTTAPGGSS